LVLDDVVSAPAAGENELALRCCGYWVSLRGLRPTMNQNKIAVSIPQA
jgi:hypothetical protein